jgi:hypothetical protein
VDNTSYMFGNNGFVVMSSTMPDSRLNGRHLDLTYHCVREAITSGMVAFCHMPGKINQSDVLSKHWGYTEIRWRIKALLFWKGDTAIPFDETTPRVTRVRGTA